MSQRLRSTSCPYPRSLTEALADFISSKTGITVPRDMWHNEKPPLHLLMNYNVVDDAGARTGDEP